MAQWESQNVSFILLTLPSCYWNIHRMIVKWPLSPGQSWAFGCCDRLGDGNCWLMASPRQLERAHKRSTSTIECNIRSFKIKILPKHGLYWGEWSPPKTSEALVGVRETLFSVVFSHSGAFTISKILHVALGDVKWAKYWTEDVILHLRTLEVVSGVLCAQWQASKEHRPELHFGPSMLNTEDVKCVLA